MERNAANLRSKHHKVLAWSIAAAVAIHVGVFVLAPEFDVEPLGGLDGENNVGDPMPILAPRVLSVFFGPPSIAMPDGSEWQEPDDRVLEAVRVTEFPPECATNARARLTQQRGSVRLRVNQGGRAAVIDLVEGTGDPCGDRLLKKRSGRPALPLAPQYPIPSPRGVGTAAHTRRGAELDQGSIATTLAPLCFAHSLGPGPTARSLEPVGRPTHRR